MHHLPTREMVGRIAGPASPWNGDGFGTMADVLRHFGHHRGTGDLDVVLSRARVGIMHRDLQSGVLTVNDAFCALVGRSAEALEGLAFEAFVHPDDAARWSRTFAAQLGKGEPFEIEQRHLRPDGTIVWCAVHVSFVLGDQAQPVSVITVASDISPRREAERELRESEEHYRYTVELNPQISWTASPDGSVQAVSPRWQAVTGVGEEDALDQRWVETLHPEDRSAAQESWAESLRARLPVDIEYRVLTRQGDYRWFRARAAPRLDGAGEVVRWYGTLEDIHDRRVAEDALRDSEERFRLAAEAAGLGIWDYDATRERREWSGVFKSMLGLDAGTEPTIKVAMERVVPEDRPLLQQLVDAAQAGDSSARFEVTLRIRRADNNAERWMRTDGWRMHEASGRLTRVLVTVRDVTEERTAEQRIRWTATHDTLTGIPNRAHFGEELEAAIARARANDTALALVLFDVDHLKEINDTIGHDAGDALLRTFATRLCDAFDDAMVGRLGGDEFAVLLEGLSRDLLTPRIERALLALRASFDHQGHACDTQATAGGSVYPLDGMTAAELLKSADIALYVGKAGRRGALSMFDPAMRGGLQRRTSMLNVARVALRDERIVPFYQPKVTLADGQVRGFEALLRWRHDLLGLQSPDTIAAAFDDMSLALALGDRMLDCIARDMAGWLDRGLEPGRIAVNLSPAEFRHEQLATRVLEPFHRNGIPFTKLELEITETVLLGRDTEKVAGILASFHREGVRVALDDFGTGYASLTHLKAFPVDAIKIDRSFVANLCEGSDDAAIVDAVIGLAHRLGIEVVAEGIEQPDQARYLLDRGCTYGQGYLFGHAMPAGDVAALIGAPAARR